jgi:hypothetical protein
MKTLQIIFLITGVALFLALAGCGGSNGEPEPPELPPVDTVVVEPPTEPANTVYIPEWSYFWLGYETSLKANMECINLIFMESNNAESREMRKGNIVGTWKLLIQYDYPPYPEERYTTDYSCRSVLYVFDADSTVTVSSDTTMIPSEVFKYAFSGNAFGCFPTYEIPELSIGEEEFACQVADQMMNASCVNYVDGDRTKPLGVSKERIFFKIKD